MPPHRFDPVTLNHYLWWQLKCADATFEGFQQLFEQVMERTEPGFEKVRPYGNIGDRKSDGWVPGTGTIYQVYSPDELTQADTQNKIVTDLAGAWKHWASRGMRRWVFVYNARRGLPPDIAGTLKAEAKKYPEVELSSMSAHDLWERLLALRLQQRAEVLGAPAGYEAYFFAPDTTDPEIVARLRDGAFVLIHDVMSPIDHQAAIEALHPRRPSGPPIRVRPDPSNEAWDVAAAMQRDIVEDALAHSEHLRPRFAVFSLSPIPLVVHLGFLLSDRVEVRPFQWDRERCSWAWDDVLGQTADCEIRTRGEPDARTSAAGDVVLRVSLSDTVAPEDTQAVIPDAVAEIDLFVKDPDRMWMRSEAQLLVLASEFRRVLKIIGQRVPNCTTVHLFAAAPTPACIVMGQAINPRMSPPVALYQYDRQRAPRHRQALTLTSD